MIRVGQGFDVHGFGGQPPVKLLGVVADAERGLEGHSDADVAAHAVIDALLGAAGLGDIGTRFPSDDGRWAGADSMEMLMAVVAELRAAGYEVVHVDVTIIAQNVRVAPVKTAMTGALARAVSPGSASVKATTTDHLGAVGRDEGVAAMAIATVSYDA